MHPLEYYLRYTDADRYRWLRQIAVKDTDGTGILSEFVDEQGLDFADSNEEFDKIIDTAIFKFSIDDFKGKDTP